jgi:hypothetical protein
MPNVAVTANTNPNTKYTCDTGQTRNKLLARCNVTTTSVCRVSGAGTRLSNRRTGSARISAVFRTTLVFVCAGPKSRPCARAR